MNRRYYSHLIKLYNMKHRWTNRTSFIHSVLFQLDSTYIFFSTTHFQTRIILISNYAYSFEKKIHNLLYGQVLFINENQHQLSNTPKIIADDHNCVFKFQLILFILCMQVMANFKRNWKEFFVGTGLADDTMWDKVDILNEIKIF